MIKKVPNLSTVSKPYSLRASSVLENNLRRVLEQNSGDWIAHNNLANLLRIAGRFCDAEIHYRLAMGQNPESAEIRNNLAGVLDELGRSDLAEMEYRAAISLQPTFAEAKFNLGMHLLAEGRYCLGWQFFEARTQIFHEHGELPFPKWNGEDLRGRSILVLPEQGYGDTILFVRYLIALKGMGAAKVSVVCKPPLAPILHTVRGIDFLITEPRSIDIHDYWISLLSLPYRLGGAHPSIPADIPYVGVFSNRLQTWKARIPATDGLRIGIVWKGNPEHHNDIHRSIRHFADLSSLWSIAGIQFISLQVGRAENEIEKCRKKQPILRLGREIRDFGDTAAIIAQLNLVLCVDTAVAHLAGALGVACWVMLPMSGVDWRWLRAGADSPWYPQRMFLFRQDKRGWSGVINDVKRALDDIIQS